jgi:chemotaxis protein methyltransferase CheR
MDLAPADFDILRRFVYDESAIVLEPGKEYLVESRLAPILRKEGLESFTELTSQLKLPSSARLRELVIDAMTTNETSFFRDTHPWDALRDQILPDLIEARRSTKRLTIWCAASSSGQESYSLAMLIHEHFPEVASSWTVKIMGTDLSPTMVDKSTRGEFTQLEVNRGLPARLLMTYFKRVGANWQIDDSLRSMVSFRRGNLIEANSWTQIPFVDAIFIRNVLIYFDKQTRTEILERVRGRLRDDGFLMLGSSETAVGIDIGFERRQYGKTVVFHPAEPDRARIGTPVGAARG